MTILPGVSRASPEPPEPGTASGPDAGQATSSWMFKACWILAVVAGAIGLALHVWNVMSRQPLHDEMVHLYFLWNTSQGIYPREGFLCPYPPTAYYLLGPLLNILPAEPWTFVLLRLGTLLPLAAVVGTVCLIARRLGRDPVLPGAWILVLLGAGELMSFWELRFDLLAWGMCFPAFYLLLWPETRWRIFWASALAVFSLSISPKHVFFVIAIAGAFAAIRIMENRRVFWRDVMAALAGAAVPVLFMTAIRVTFVADVIDLTLMNAKAQTVSIYPDELPGSLLRLFVSDPALMSVVWVAPARFILQASEQRRGAVIMFAAVIAGALACILLIPAGYDQYYSLVWAICLLTLPWAVPQRGSGRLSLAVATALVVLAGFYAAREAVVPRIRGMSAYLEFQEELLRICPKGENSASAVDYGPWFRRFPGYSMIDNMPSYSGFVRPFRQRLFGADYFEEQLLARPPAIFCPVGLTDQYTIAMARFLDRHQNMYESYSLKSDVIPGLAVGKMFYMIRKDLTNRVVLAKAESMPR